jgi:hypothetical protein
VNALAIAAAAVLKRRAALGRRGRATSAPAPSTARPAALAPTQEDHQV